MFKKILVAVDGSAVSNNGLDTAVDLAIRYDAQLIVAHAIDESVLPSHHGSDSFVDHDKLREAWHKEGAKVIADARKRLADKQLKLESVLLESVYSVDDQIAKAVATNSIDLLVIGSHGRRGLQRLFLGSVAEKLARKVDCAVFIVKDRNVAL